MKSKQQCPECGRIFDLRDPDDADEWAYGHDCEPGPIFGSDDDPLAGAREDAAVALREAIRNFLALPSDLHVFPQTIDGLRTDLYDWFSRYEGPDDPEDPFTTIIEEAQSWQQEDL